MISLGKEHHYPLSSLLHHLSLLSPPSPLQQCETNPFLSPSRVEDSIHLGLLEAGNIQGFAWREYLTLREERGERREERGKGREGRVKRSEENREERRMVAIMWVFKVYANLFLMEKREKKEKREGGRNLSMRWSPEGLTVICWRVSVSWRPFGGAPP